MTSIQARALAIQSHLTAFGVHIVLEHVAAVLKLNEELQSVAQAPVISEEEHKMLQELFISLN